MKKILLATTALAFSAGFAAAEVSFSGQAKMGLNYDGGLEEETSVHSEAVLYVAMSGETDTGLAFGATIDMIVEDNGDLANDDTTVFISGAFGKLSMGAVPEADENGGISDIGWDDLDLDDIAENISGDELDDYSDGDFSLDHNVNYTYSADAFSVSVSARIGDEDVDSAAIGGKYNFGDAYVGLGYAKHSLNDTEIDAKVATAVAGGTFGAFGVAAMYSDGEIELGAGADIDVDAFGLRASYTMDAWTFVAAYSESSADANFVDFDGVLDQEGYGLAAAYDLGGGAQIAGGIARVDRGIDLDTGVDGGKETVADFGVTMSF